MHCLLCRGVFSILRSDQRESLDEFPPYMNHAGYQFYLQGGFTVFAHLLKSIVTGITIAHDIALITRQYFSGFRGTSCLGVVIKRDLMLLPEPCAGRNPYIGLTGRRTVRLVFLQRSALPETLT